jgi:hypothetical protein
MYNGNVMLRHQGQEIEYSDELLTEYMKCKEDIIYFAEKYFKIITIDEGEHYIKLFDFQKKMLKAFVGDGDERQHLALCSSRQIGKTTISTIYILWYILFREDKTCAVLANREKTAFEILKRIKEAYMNLPLWLQQGVQDGGWNKSEILLENKCRILAGSTASSAIRGYVINLLFLDEFAFVPNGIADDFMASVYPTIVTGKTSKIIIASTPNGMNHFYHIWRKSIKGENGFRPIKVNWWEVPGRDEKFKENTIKDIGIVRWNQEFLARFLGSTSTLIDSDLLERMGANTMDPLHLSMGDLLYVYERPEPDVMYIMGVDTAKGTGGDYSCVQVLKINNEHDIDHVATYRCNTIAPHDFSQVCISISQYYNGCYMMVENNDVGGQVADSIHFEYEYDLILNTDKKGIGTRSTSKSKLVANMLMKRYLESGWLDIKDPRTVYEFGVYEEVRPDVFQAPRTEHDDCVTSLLWALYFLCTEFFDSKSIGVKTIDSKYFIEGGDYDLPIMMSDAPEHNYDTDGFDWGANSEDWM